jgi:PTS system nitrogen regulatory IIA component
MQLDTILTPERTLCRANASDKQQVLESCARFLSESVPALDADALLQSLLARERLGSTGLGNGIAIPHCRLKNIDHVVGALITLAKPVEFEAVDDKLVDIIFVLIAPAAAMQQHLNALAALAELFNRSEFRDQLRNAETSAQLYQTAIEFHA